MREYSYFERDENGEKVLVVVTDFTDEGGAKVKDYKPTTTAYLDDELVMEYPDFGDFDELYDAMNGDDYSAVTALKVADMGWFCVTRCREVGDTEQEQGWKEKAREGLSAANASLQDLITWYNAVASEMGEREFDPDVG